MWDLSAPPGIKPVSPALEGGFVTTGPPFLSFLKWVYATYYVESSLQVKIPWRRARHLNPVFLPGEPHGQRSLVGHSPQRRRSWTLLKRLSTHAHRLYSNFEMNEKPEAYRS